MYSEHCSFTRKTTRRMTESRKEGLESFQGRGGFKSRWHRLATLFMFFHRRFPLPLIQYEKLYHANRVRLRRFSFSLVKSVSQATRKVEQPSQQFRTRC